MLLNFRNDQLACFWILGVFDLHVSAFQEYSIGMFLRQTWNDSRLTYRPLPRLRSLELDSRLMEKIWVPDLFIPNEKEAHFHVVTVPNKLMHIYPEGRVQYSVRYEPLLKS